MNNVFDYLDWRGDLNFCQSEFNEVDALIFSRLSYLSFNNIIEVENKNFVHIKDLLDKVDHLVDETTNLKQYSDIEMIKKMADTKRFSEIQIGGQVEIRDRKKTKQFSATLFKITKDLLVVAYRGTDGSEEGWKENFNMSYMSPVPAQKESVKYLELVAETYPYDLIVCGHSKGGNLAIFSSTFCNKLTQDKIKRVYNNDGPGFNSEIIEKEEFDLIKDRIYTFVPQSSIVGMLMEHREEYQIVKSSSISVLQHNLYSWEVMGNKFVYSEDLSDSSKVFRDTVRMWLEDMSQKELEMFINILFNAIESLDKDREKESKKEKKEKSFEENLYDLINSIKKLKIEGSIISKAVDSFLDSAKLNISDYIESLKK